MSEQEKLSRISLENGVFETNLTAKFARRKLYEKKDPRLVRAIIPGVVATIQAAAGTAVKKGDTVITLEAMKMLNRIPSPMDGTVKAVRVSKGQKVSKGQVLVEIK